MSFLAIPLALFSGSVDDTNHPLGAGMNVEVPNLYRLLVPPPMPVEGLDHFKLKSKKLNGVVPIDADIDLIEVMLGLAQKFRAREPDSRNFDREQSFELGLRLH
ncbi:MAG: hypothetical protein ABSB37_10160 [Xanthobacteraceae bacterium]